MFCFVLFLCSGERAAPAFALIVLLALMARVPSFECVCVCVCVCRVFARIGFFFCVYFFFLTFFLLFLLLLLQRAAVAFALADRTARALMVQSTVCVCVFVCVSYIRA